MFQPPRHQVHRTSTPTPALRRLNIAPRETSLFRAIANLPLDVITEGMILENLEEQFWALAEPKP
jgi:hypothetical protein